MIATTLAGQDRIEDSADEVTVDDPVSPEAALATGRGNATAAGVTLQGAIGALLSAAAITDRLLDAKLGIGAVRVKELRFETEAPLDDILTATDADGYIFIQAKTSLTLSQKLDSELGKTAEQIVRQWIACSNGDGTLGWNRPLTLGRDLFLIAVGPVQPARSPMIWHRLSLAPDRRQLIRQLDRLFRSICARCSTEL